MSQLASIMFNSEKPLTKRPEKLQASLAFRVGHIVSVSGPQAVAVLDGPKDQLGLDSENRIEIGSLVTIPTPGAAVVGIVSGMTTPMPGATDDAVEEIRLIEISLAGEINKYSASEKMQFHRGVAHFPTIGCADHRCRNPLSG